MKHHIQEAVRLKEKILKDSDILSNIESVIDLISTTINNGGKLLIAGNGGSAADAQHFAAEIVGRFIRERRGYPAIALTTDTSVITSIGNDYGFEFIFERQVEAIAVKKDLFIGISTTGNSKNIIRGIERAKNMGVMTVAFLGNEGGEIAGIADLNIIVPSHSTPRIQEVHTMLVHIISEEVEKNFV